MRSETEERSPIIDAHVHVYSRTLAPHFWIDQMARYGSAISRRSVEDVRDVIEEQWFDHDGSLLLADMDAAGIDQSIIFAMDFGLHVGVDDNLSLEQRYDAFHAIVARSPDRFFLFGGIDPRRPDACTFIRRAVGEWNLRGIKIWTPAGIYPNDPYCYRLYETAAELRLPVVIHTGQEISPFCSHSTRPLLCDDPIRQFPEVTFVLAHAGMAWWPEAAEIAWHHPNVYLDIAYWQSKYLRNEVAFITDLRQLMSAAGKQKLLFGTDWPAFRAVPRVDHASWVTFLMSLTRDASNSVSFTAQEIAMLLGENAVRLLRSAS